MLMEFLKSLGRIFLGSLVGLILAILALAFVLLITGCQTSKNNKPTTTSNTLKLLHYKIDYSDYELTNKLCFAELDICNLKTLQICKQNQTCQKKSEKSCWLTHEKCIIDNHKKWQRLEIDRKSVV